MRKVGFLVCMLLVVGSAFAYEVGDTFAIPEEVASTWTGPEALTGDFTCIFKYVDEAAFTKGHWYLDYFDDMWTLYDTGVLGLVAMRALGTIDEVPVSGWTVVAGAISYFSDGGAAFEGDWPDGSVSTGSPAVDEVLETVGDDILAAIEMALIAIASVVGAFVVVWLVIMVQAWFAVSLGRSAK